MFDVAFSEICVVAVVAIVVLGPKDAVTIIKNAKKIYSNLESSARDYIKYLSDECGVSDIKESILEEDEIVKYIIDLDGNMQSTYDLSKIMPEIKEQDVRFRK